MIKAQIDNFRKYKQLIRQLVTRDLKTRYRRSILGFLWTILNPLGMMIILTIVFSKVFRGGIENFPVYLMCGQLVFGFFNEASTGAMHSILESSSLITKVYVPKYLFPMSKVCSSAVNFVFSLVALLIVIFATRFKLTWTIIWIVFPMIYVSIFSFGIGLILATVVVFFRDMKHLYGILTTAWMYLTPVIYPISILPERAQMIVKMNPMTMYVEMFRDAVMYNTIPTLSSHLMCLAIGMVMLLLGLFVFKKNQDKFILHF